MAAPAHAPALCPPGWIPRLESGDRLTAREFRRRYEAHPEIRKAELVAGVVYVASPVSIDHSHPHGDIITWLGVYKAATPGLRLAVDGTLRIDARTEVQPDIMLYWDETHGGRVRVAEGRYLEGAPDLVVEVAASSASYDLHSKKRAYARAGVREYLVWRVHEQRIDWWTLRGGDYVPLPADERGVVASEAFPGLRLDIEKMLAGDLGAVLAELNTAG